MGVARQYCGQVGKQDNCQVAVSLSSPPIREACRLPIGCIYPRSGPKIQLGRKIAGVPDEVRFQTKPEIALQQLRQALADGVPPGVALMDPAYGNDSKLRAGISELGLTYVAGIMSTTMVWRPGEAPLPPRPARAAGGPARGCDATRRINLFQPRHWLWSFDADAWQTITWRDGSNTPLTSRFARWRVRPAHDDARRSEPAAEEWLLIEWPEGEAEPDHYWLSTLPADISLERMVDQAKLRWRIERDYLELKQEVGLGHYEGRGWRGFHHHANSMCCSLRIPDLREGDDSPLRTGTRLARHATSPSRWLSTQRICRCVRSATCRTQSQRLRIRLARALAHALPRCPCCGQHASAGGQAK